MIYFVIPVYNEKDNILNLKKELLSALQGEDKFYVFSDDGSKDGSPELLKHEFANERFVVLGDGLNRGPGAAFNLAFEWVMAHSKDDGDRVVSVEADCTSDLGILPQMLSLSRMGYELVLASVYAQSGGFEHTNWMRRFISALANITMRFAFNIRVLTLSSFYRVYSVGLLRKIRTRYPALIAEPGFICMLEILVKAIRVDARIIEVPTTLRSSKRIGKSKMKTVSTAFQYLKFLFRKQL
ncbi:MAG TPA: glycosyltransferase [Bacteroidia bacterium]|nr:glycosyltransferase [Bacteroidia bacterium]